MFQSLEVCAPDFANDWKFAMEHPFLDPSFEIKWSRLTPEHVEPDIALAVERAQANLAALRGLAGADLTFERVLLGFEAATRELNLAWTLVQHLDAVNNAPVLRQAYNAMLPRVSAFYTAIYLDAGLWAVIKAYAATAEAKALTGVRKRFLDETIADFRESGADLSDDGKKRLEAVNAELAQAAQKFAENVLDATNAWEKIVTDEALLEGLPDSARRLAREQARKKNLGSDETPAWRFTLHQPSLVPVLQYAANEAIRRECWQASVDVARKAPYENRELVWKILDLRREKARLLGFTDFADLVTHRRMARTGGTALRFIEDLHDRVHGFFLREIAELEQYKAKQDGLAATPAREDRAAAAPRLQPWELAYWAEKQRKEKYDFDPELLRPYLPMDGVIRGLFTLARQVFGVEVREAAGPVEVWHPEVKYYEVLDGARKLGAFYCDWHPRESKRGGAWMNFFHTGGPGPDGAWRPHLGLMCGNLTPPAGGKPALLTHDEVTTVFHEFGHLLHHLLSEVGIESLSGTRVAWDFVELPSQLLENWCWHKESLDLFARHYETGESIPADLLEKMLRARNYRAASAMMGQLCFGKCDLDLHIRLEDVRGMDLDEHWRGRLAGYCTPVATPAPARTASFTHVFGDSTGYAAGYYSYKWAEVLEADAFTRFLREGILNPATGREFRAKILARGNAERPEVLFRDFMGRDPDLHALLEREGLSQDARPDRCAQEV